MRPMKAGTPRLRCDNCRARGRAGRDVSLCNVFGRKMNLCTECLRAGERVAAALVQQKSGQQAHA